MDIIITNRSNNTRPLLRDKYKVVHSNRHHRQTCQHKLRKDDSKSIGLLICTRINDQYEQTWHSSIPAHIRCSYYVLFKDNRKLEPYFYKLSTSNRIYLSKFRCRSNYMPVSKVYKHADTYDTKCKLCDKNEIGDDFHY